MYPIFRQLHLISESLGSPKKRCCQCLALLESEDDEEGRLLESGDRLAIGQGHSAGRGKMMMMMMMMIIIIMMMAARLEVDDSVAHCA